MVEQNTDPKLSQPIASLHKVVNNASNFDFLLRKRGAINATSTERQDQEQLQTKGVHELNNGGQAHDKVTERAEALKDLGSKFSAIVSLTVELLNKKAGLEKKQFNDELRALIRELTALSIRIGLASQDQRVGDYIIALLNPLENYVNLGEANIDKQRARPEVGAGQQVARVAVLRDAIEAETGDKYKRNVLDVIARARVEERVRKQIFTPGEGKNIGMVNELKILLGIEMSSLSEDEVLNLDERSLKISLALRKRLEFLFYF